MYNPVREKSQFRVRKNAATTAKHSPQRAVYSYHPTFFHLVREEKKLRCLFFFGFSPNPNWYDAITGTCRQPKKNVIQTPGMGTSRRIQREKKTVKVMIRHYCRLFHGNIGDPCTVCSGLERYAEKRLDACPFQEGKTTCSKCHVHCYTPEKREQIRKVMCTIGPRMLLLNPVMGLRHVLDGLRRVPQKKKT
jgi:hypothetical protein